jgi:hypothetical protein
MPRKPLEPDDSLRNCLPMASGRGGDNPGASEERGFGEAHRMVTGRACRLSTATLSPAEGPRAKQGRTPARASGLSQLR